jgi:ATP-dependent helicase/nuclease subunit B
LSAKISIVVGPARSGKTESLLATYRRTLASGGGLGARSLWLAPNRRAVEHVRDRLLTPDFPACFAPGIQTFDRFADEILAYSAEEIRPIDDRMKRLVIEKLLAEAAAKGKLKHFASIAGTPGLVDLAAGFISELKRVEIWPEEFEKACRESAALGAPQGRLSARDQELFALYRDYQATLNRAQLYDLEGRFWNARHLLQQGQAEPFGKLKLVVVDGFTDFTRTQHEILEQLAARAEEVVVSLLDEAETRRPDLFAKPRTTLAQLTERHPTATVNRLARRDPAVSPAFDHVERQLFMSPRETTKQADTAGIEFIAAVGAVGEMEQLARRVKRLLVFGDESASAGGATGAQPAPVRPDDIVVMFRSVDESAPLVREIFTRYGIPTAIETGRSLSRSPSLTALVALVALDAEDWPFAHLLGTVGSNYFAPAWAEVHRDGVEAATERTIRCLQIPHGRKELLEAIERLALSKPVEIEADDPFIDGKRTRNRRRSDAILALPVLKKLAETFDNMPRSATAAGWAEALETLARETGLWHRMHDVEEHPLVSQPVRTKREDITAWGVFVKALKSADDLAELLGDDAPTFDRAAMRSRIEATIDAEQLPGDLDETGRVRVLSAATARTLSVPHLFLAELTEKAFPRPESSGRLYSDVEYQQLARHGLPLKSTIDRQRDEMLLFYEAVTRATTRLYLSYAALNEKAETLLPSPYLAELRQLFVLPEAAGGAGISDLSPVPPADAMLNPFDARIRATVAAAAGDVAEFAGVLGTYGEVGENLARGLSIVFDRSHGSGFGVNEGMITSPAALDKLARHFHEHFPWSASQLEQYNACPFRFFMERVLKVRSPDDVGLELDYRERGTRLHDVMAGLHQGLNESFTTPALPREAATVEYQQLVNRLILKAEADADDDPTSRALRAIDEKLLRRWLDTYLEQHEKYESTYSQLGEIPRPKHFEASFGLPNLKPDGVSKRKPLELKLKDEQISITGQIDRIDVGAVAGKAVFSIVDYKTGKGAGYTKNDVLDGRAMQLTLYAIAAEKLLFADKPAVPWQFGYWFIAERGFKKTLSLHDFEKDKLTPTDDWAALKERIVEQVLSIARGIRRGEFPMYNTDEQCTSYCELKTVCRVAQVRNLEKQWQLPQLLRS